MCQIGVEAEYIVHVGIFSSANNVTTLIPFLTSMESRLSQTYERVIADAGYESEENYAYLKENNQKVFIKPLNYEASKTRKYKAQLGKRENMAYDELTDTYTCANGRTLKPMEVKAEKVGRDIEKKSRFMNVKLAKIVPCVQNVQKRRKETINE